MRSRGMPRQVQLVLQIIRHEAIHPVMRILVPPDQLQPVGLSLVKPTDSDRVGQLSWISPNKGLISRKTLAERGIGSIAVAVVGIL